MDPFPHLAVMLLLMQSRTLLAAFPARAHCCLVNLALTRQPWHVLEPGVVPPQGQDSAFLLAEQHKVPLSPCLQPMQVPQSGSMTLWCYQPLLPALCQLLRVHPIPSSLINILMKMLNSHFSYQPLGCTTGLQLDFVSRIAASFQSHLSNLGFVTSPVRMLRAPPAKVHSTHCLALSPAWLQEAVEKVLISHQHPPCH